MARPTALMCPGENRVFSELSDCLSLKGFSVINCAFNEIALIIKILKFKPQVLVIDFSQFQDIRSAKRIAEFKLTREIQIIVNLCPYNNLEMQKTYNVYGIDANYRYPFEYEVVANEIYDLYCRLPHDLSALEEDIDNCISGFLRGFNFKISKTGYNYTKSAIRYLLKNKEIAVPNFSAQIYTKIAQEYATTPAAVERAIRSSISDAWKRCGERVKDDLTLDNESRLTTKEFIMRSVRYIYDLNKPIFDEYYRQLKRRQAD